MTKVYDAYKNIISGLGGIFIYLMLFGYTTVTLHDFCCYNFKLNGWGD